MLALEGVLHTGQGKLTEMWTDEDIQRVVAVYSGGISRPQVEYFSSKIKQQRRICTK